jgi:hypothetical protein
MPNLSAGSGAVVAETTQVSRPSSARMDYLKFEEGKRVFFRIATDDIITADTHRFLPVLTQPPAEMVAKAKEAKKEVKWPQTLWSVCQDDRIFLNTDEAGEPIKGSYEAGYGDCRVKHIFKGKKGKYDKDLTKADRLTYVVVVLQEATWDNSSGTNKLTGIRDVTEKWTDKDGQDVIVPALRYVQAFYRSIFSPMLNTVALDPNGQLMGTSWMVKRDGKDYTVAPVNGAKATEAELEAYAKTLDMMGFTLGDFILAHASDDHLDRFWGDGSGAVAADSGGNGAGSAPEPDTAQAAPLDPEAQLNLTDFEARLTGQVKDAGAKDAAEPAETAELSVSS